MGWALPRTFTSIDLTSGNARTTNTHGLRFRRTLAGVCSGDGFVLRLFLLGHRKAERHHVALRSSNVTQGTGRCRRRMHRFPCQLVYMARRTLRVFRHNSRMLDRHNEPLISSKDASRIQTWDRAHVDCKF